MADLNSPITINDVIQKVNESSLPDTTGHTGEFLKAGSDGLEWDSVDALPSQTGNAGKSLYTDGTDASWEVTRDPNTYRSLSSIQAETLLDYGTYNGEEVTSGEIFTAYDGSFKEFNDDVTYGGDKALDFTLRYGNSINSKCSFNFGAGNKGIVFSSKYGEYTQGRFCIKEETLTALEIMVYSTPVFFNDGSKVYQITTNSVYRASTDGTTWSNEVGFSSGFNSDQLARASYYKALGKILIFIHKGSYGGQNLAYAYSDSMDTAFTAGTFPEGVSVEDTCRVLVYSDEVRLLDFTTGKIYSTTDFSQGWTEVSGTFTFPSGNTFEVLGGVALSYNVSGTNGVYYSLDRGETWSATNLPNGTYRWLSYCEDAQTWVAVNANNTSNYYTSIDGHTFTTQTPSTGTTIYGNLLGVSDKAYTISSSGSSVIYTGAEHHRSLTTLSGTKATDIAEAGDGITLIEVPTAVTKNLNSSDEIGSPTISELGLFKPTNSSYIRLSSASVGTNPAYPIVNSGYDWELTVKVKTPSNYSSGITSRLWDFAPAYNSNEGMNLQINDNGTLSFYFWKGGSWDGITGTDALDPNTWYYIKVSHNASTGLSLESSKNGETWKLEGTSATTGGFTGQGDNQYFFLTDVVDASHLALEYDLTGLSFKSSYNDTDWVAYIIDETKTEISVDIGYGVPDSSTEGYVGKISVDSSGNAYMCVGVSGSTYTWKQITLTSI